MNIFFIVAVMIGCGILGGAINYLLNTPAENKTYCFVKNIVVGIGASLLVPLFLNMISSSLFQDICQPSQNDKLYANLFTLIGFCLIASISARQFIQSVSQKIIKDVEEVKSELEDVKESMKPIESLFEDDTPDPAPTDATMQPESRAPEMTKEEASVLRVLGSSNYIMRSLSGIRADTGLEKRSINTLLNKLIQDNLVQQMPGKNSGQPRWFLTQNGRKAVAQLPPDEKT